MFLIVGESFTKFGTVCGIGGDLLELNKLIEFEFPIVLDQLAILEADTIDKESHQCGSFYELSDDWSFNNFFLNW